MVKKPAIYVDEFESLIGTLTVCCLEEGICYLSFGSLKESESVIKTWAKKQMLHNELEKDRTYTAEPVKQLQAYFEGERQVFELSLALKGTPFQIKVWQSLQAIPYGETRTYKEIAQMIGNPKSVRAVGGANNKNPIPIIIPCHRVIGSSGALIGYGGGLDKKEVLLKHENSNGV